LPIVASLGKQHSDGDSFAVFGFKPRNYNRAIAHGNRMQQPHQAIDDTHDKVEAFGRSRTETEGWHLFLKGVKRHSIEAAGFVISHRSMMKAILDLYSIFASDCIHKPEFFP
jgi:type IV secretory pathway VirB9-like protein